MKKATNNLTNIFVVCIIAMVCCLLWGSAFPCIKIGYKLFNISSSDNVTQLLFAGVRFFLAGVMVILFYCVNQRRFIYPKGKTIKRVGILSLFQTILQYLFFYIGLAHTTGVKASIIEGANVFIAILVAGYIFSQENVTAKKLIGCAVGFAGVILVNVWGQGLDMSFKLTGEGFILISTVAYAFSSAIIKEYSKEEDTVVLSGYQFMFGGFVMVVIGFILGGRINSCSVGAVVLLLYMAFISAAAYTLWSVLLKHNPVSRVSVFGFMNPVFGVILSGALLTENEKMQPIVCITALLLVSAGIVIVNANGGKDGNIRD